MTLDCNPEKIVLLITGEADEAERRDIEAHLKICRKCREEFERLQLAWQAVDALPLEQPSLEVMAALRSRLGVERVVAGRRRIVHTLRWAAVAAAAAVLIAVVSYWPRMTSEPDLDALAVDDRLLQVEADVEELASYPLGAEDPLQKRWDLSAAGADTTIQNMEEDLDVLRADWIVRNLING